MDKPNDSEMCAPGFHVVRGHRRICKSGTTTWVDAHIRKNRGKIRPGLLKENILYLYWTNKKSYPALKPVKGFERVGSEYDSVIQFWLEYWKRDGLQFPDGLNAQIIKTIIAVESGFKERAKNASSTAEGLMQLTDSVLRILGGFPGKDGYLEAKDQLIHLSKADKLDPVINICLGVRLVGHKYWLLRNSKTRDVWAVVGNYNSRGNPGKVYAERIRKLYELSK